MSADPRSAGRLVFLLALTVYLATTGGSMATDIMSYEVTKDIVEHGTVAMSYNVFQMDAHRGVDGRYYAPYGIGHALYSIPFYVAARVVERASGLRLGKPEVLTKAGFVAGSAVAAALTVWVAFLFSWRLSNDVGASILAAMAVAFATLLWPYAKFGFNAPLATLCVVFGTYGVWVGTRLNRARMLVLGGIGLGGALLVKHELALVCLPIGVWIIVESKWDWPLVVKRGLLSGVPVAVAAVITGYYNYLRFGNPLDTGYLRDETLAVGSFWSGLVGLLFSPGRSVFVYSPIVLTGVAALVVMARRGSTSGASSASSASSAGGASRASRTTAMLLGGEFVLMLCFYASLVNWDGERSYGPRYLLPVIPLLVIPLSVLGRRHWLTAAVVLGVALQLPGVFVDFSKVGAARVIGPRTEEQRQWTWEASGLAINTRAALAALPQNATALVTNRRPPVKPGDSDTRDFSDQFASSLDFWWVYVFYLGVVSGPVALMLGVACFGIVAVLAWRLDGLLLIDAHSRST